jgi:uncharacterized protein YecE (DUF72 family)
VDARVITVAEADAASLAGDTNGRVAPAARPSCRTQVSHEAGRKATPVFNAPIEHSAFRFALGTPHPAQFRTSHSEFEMIWIGTSGYNYPEWKGTFYPADLPASKMLPFYAARFPTVEINYTFYRLPTEKMVAAWAAATPDAFRLTLKAPKRITHDRRLRDCAELTQAFCSVAGTLGGKLGVLLFQLAPTFRKDLVVFDAFLRDLPPGARAAFEFRHASWFDEDMFVRLRDRNLALCIADSERMSTPLVPTADYGYLRLRDEGYTPDAIRDWARVIRTHEPTWKDTYVYFKHEEAGRGPEFGAALMLELGL